MAPETVAVALPEPDPVPRRVRAQEPDSAPMPPLPPGALESVLRDQGTLRAQPGADPDAADASDPTLTVADRARRMLERRLAMLGRIASGSGDATVQDQLAALREIAKIAAGDTAPAKQARTLDVVRAEIAQRVDARARELLAQRGTGGD